MPYRKVIAFLPCRKGSQRVPNKNTQKFGNFDNGLIEIKIQQLISCANIDKIILSTNDDTILDFFKGEHEDKLLFDKRREELSSSSTSTDDLIGYIPELIKEDQVHILWTHVTSPFIDEKTYDQAIKEYLKSVENGYDSMVSVTKIQKFIWNDNGPVNYDYSREKWPRTQTLKPLYEINSGFFINSIENYRLYSDRIGKNPKFFELSQLQSFDIDWKEDFELADIIWKHYAL